MKNKLAIILSIVFLLPLGSMAFEHPGIWVSAGDKARILDNISKYSWAANFNAQLHTRVDAKKNTHKTNPSGLLNTMPTFGATDRTGHNNMLTLGTESALLYYLTEDDDYAQLSADILSAYVETLSLQDTSVINFYNDHWIESRAVFPKLPVIYDLIDPFLQKQGTTVFDNVSKTRKPFSHAAAQTTVKKLAASTLKGIDALKTNHSVLAGNGALFNILMIEDDATREKFFARFWSNPLNQRFDAFTWTLGNFTAGEGLWPETITYGKGPQEIVLQLMHVIDRFKPELDIFKNNLRILDGAFSYENFKYPNSSAIMAYGDSRRYNVDTQDLYRRVLAIATRRNMTTYIQKSSAILKQIYSDGAYTPAVETQTLEWDNLLHLLWGVNIDPSVEGEKIKFNATAVATHAGIIMQRNYFCADSKMNGLMCYTGGAHYVHSHCSGLDLELYGAGYVMGGVAGDMPTTADRALPVNTNYYRIYAGHNTVIVNGTSQGRGSGSWKSDGLLWQNTTVLLASEPKPLEEPISESFSFTSQLLEDKINNCDQQRTVSIVRTSATTGYYIDFFRSKSLGVNNFHDYIYHNIGDEMLVADSQNNALALISTPARYQSIPVTYTGATINFPGWHYFETVKISAPTSNAVKTRIKLNTLANRYMHI